MNMYDDVNTDRPTPVGEPPPYPPRPDFPPGPSNAELVGRIRKAGTLAWVRVDRHTDEITLPERLARQLDEADRAIAELRGRIRDLTAGLSDAVAEGQLAHIGNVLDGRAGR